MFRKVLVSGLVAVLALCAGMESSGESSLAAGGNPHDETIDEKFARVADRMPDFGGMFVDEKTGTLFVYVKKATPEKAKAAKAALEAEFGREHLPQGNVQALEAKFNSRQLKHWHDKAIDILAMPGVTMTDIDDKKNRLTVGIATQEARSAVQQRLNQFGVPSDAVEIELEEPETQFGLTDRVRPLVGGLQIARPIDATSSAICTEGFNAVRGGVNGFLTNSHCSATQCGLDSAVFHQAWVGTTNRVGTETVDPPCYGATKFGCFVKAGNPMCMYLPTGCPAGRTCRRSDASFVATDVGVDINLGRIARTTLGSTNWNGTDTHRIVAEADPLVGMTIRKVGRSSGTTQGTVTDTCVNRNAFKNGVDTGITMLCQARATLNGGGGDSGAPVFTVTNSPSTNDVKLLGILWGGGQQADGMTYANFSPMANIQGNWELGALTTCASGFNC